MIITIIGPKLKQAENNFFKINNLLREKLKN